MGQCVTGPNTPAGIAATVTTCRGRAVFVVDVGGVFAASVVVIAVVVDENYAPKTWGDTMRRSPLSNVGVPQACV